MKNTTKVGNMAMIEQLSYICDKKEFTSETDKPDGCQLEVVDDLPDGGKKVVGYYVAYNGYWYER